MSTLVELTNKTLASPANSFFAIGDPQNLFPETVSRPVGPNLLKEELHFYLLFSERLTLVAEDLLLNEPLMRILLSGEYSTLLTQGIFVPLLRSHYDSLADVTEYLKQPDLYTPVMEEVWRPLLNRLNKIKVYVGRFDEKEAYSNFTEIVMFYMFDEAFMKRFNAGELATAMPREIDRLRQHANRTELRRSLFFQYALELDRSRQKRLARLVRHIASVLYTAQFCGHFRQLPAFPDWYSKILTKTTGITPQIESDVSVIREIKSLALKYTSAAIKPEAGLATIEDILEIRTSKQFHRFMSDTKQFNEGGADDKILKRKFVHSLHEYLLFLDQRFAELARGIRKEKKSLDKQISIFEMSTPVGVVLGITSLALTSALDSALAKAISPLWWYASLSFFAIKKELKREVERMDLESAKFWSMRCSPGGTFAASLIGAGTLIERKLTKERPIPGK